MTTMHRRPLELAATAIDFELSAREREELDGHLAGCSLCRSRVDGLRRDAHSVEALPILPVTADQSARLRAATLRRPERAAASALRLVAIAAILALLALAAVAVGSSLIDRDPVDLSVVEPVPSPSVPPRVSPTPVPSVAPPSATLDAEPAGFQPPDPICPAPTEAVPPPAIRLDTADGEIVLPTTIAEQLVMTCSTTAPTDGVGAEPEVGEVAYLGDEIAVSVGEDWRILYWEGSERPRSGDGINVITGETRADGPSTITVPVPDREGDTILGLTIWAQSTDGRVVASTSLAAWLQIEPRPGAVPAAAPGALTQGLGNVGCDSVGWPEDVPEYSTLTFRMDTAEPGYVTARSDTGARLDVLWEGADFQIGTDSVLDAGGAVVVEDGDAIDVPSDGSLPRLGDYSVCLNPQRLIVFVPD
ncbi:MAG TPA: zf-HC2 domain-containing protein [Candidatus Limnocylindrales bacterium]|nr:zf-HC2 domain-containing protein [Candidatus Limnocylindrales bacterium]